MKFKLLTLLSSLLLLGSAQANNLSNIYEKLDQTLTKQIKQTFQTNASEEQIQSLRNTFVKGNKLPQDLENLFRWSNGQKQGSPLSQDHNRRMLSIAESIEQKEFFDDNLLDIMLPWKDSWVPILTNESGDFVVYELEGDNQGKLISYYHDWDHRGIENDSIELFIISLIDEYKKPQAKANQ